MPDYGGSDFSGQPSMEAVLRTDSFVDALATGGPVAPQDAADAELAALLGGWRDEMRQPPATDLITESEAIAALSAGLGGKRGGGIRDRRGTPPAPVVPRRSHRGLSIIGAAAAAVLGIGGFGAVVAGSGPGDTLYGVRSMLFGAPKEVRDDQVALAAKTELAQVQNLIAQGDWQQAQDKLVAVSTQVASIGDQQQKQELLDQFNDLSAKVVERDPEAIAPPGITYTVPPSATELVPAVAPTSTPSAPPPSGSTAASESSSTPPESSTSSAATSGTESSAPSSSGAPTTSASASTPSSSGAPSTSAPSTSAPSTSAGGTSAQSTSAPSSSASQQNQQTTTPTSAAPTTSTATRSTTPTTTSAPAAAASTTPEASEQADEATADETTSAQATADETTAAETTSAQSRSAQTTSAPTTTAVETPETEAVETSAETEDAEPETVQSPSTAAATTTAAVPTPVPVGG